MVLLLLDWVLTLVHTLVVLGNLLLWIPRRTLRLHLVLVLCTTASWLGLGAFYGVGYCFLTDWHWRIKHARGETGLPGSFIEYGLEWLARSDLDPAWIKQVTIWAFVGAATLSIALNLLAERRKRRASRAVPK
jgi:uncharacterized protein DUF2784